jgi:hypothetical protein
MEHVISIDENGELQSLMHKKGMGIDLREFGDAEIERVSLVEFDNTEKKFFVRFLKGPLADRVLTYPLYAAATGTPVKFLNSQPVMFFDDYEDGVAAEVRVLDALRKRGITETLAVQAVS